MKNYLVMNLCDENIDIPTAIKLVDSEKSISELITSDATYFMQIGVKKDEMVNMIKNALIAICHDHQISIMVLAYFGVNPSVIANLKQFGIFYAYQLLIYPQELLKKRNRLSPAAISKIATVMPLLNISLDFNDLGVSSYINNLLEDNAYLALIERSILKNLTDDYQEYDLLQSKMPEEFVYPIVFDYALDALVNIGAIEFSLFGIKKLTLHLQEFLVSLEDTKAKSILLDYLHGSSFEAISKSQNINIPFVKSALGHFNFPVLVENCYLDFYRKYYFTADNFCKIFKENLMCYRYLELLAKNQIGKRPILEILEDPNASAEIKLRVQNTLGEYAYLYGLRVTKKIAAIFVIFAKYNLTKALDEVIIERNFRDFYYEQFHDNINFKPNQIVTLLNETKNIITSANGYRYYDISNMDIETFYKGLNLICYDAIEISSRLLFDANLELMKTYSIYDEYELFSIMRKTYYGSNIEFVHKTDLIINGGNRNNQIKSLILKKSPIALNDFVKLYSNSYGVKEKSFSNYVTSKFSPYYAKGQLECAIPLPNEENFKIFKELLTKDFYFIKDLFQLAYDRKLILDESYFQMKVMNMVGYIAYNDFIFSAKYHSLEDYLETYFLADEIKLFSLDQRIAILPQFKAALTNHLRNLDYIEVDKDIYVKQHTLKTEELTSFAQSISDYIYNDEIFTIKSLLQKGFSNPLLNLGYKDIFYSSILKAFDNFISYNVSNSTVVLFKIKYVDDEVNMIKLLEQILENKPLSFEEITAVLEIKYGILLANYQLKQLLLTSFAFYDNESNKYYLDYNSYLN